MEEMEEDYEDLYQGLDGDRTHCLGNAACERVVTPPCDSKDLMMARKLDDTSTPESFPDEMSHFEKLIEEERMKIEEQKKQKRREHENLIIENKQLKEENDSLKKANEALQKSLDELSQRSSRIIKKKDDVIAEKDTKIQDLQEELEHLISERLSNARAYSSRPYYHKSMQKNERTSAQEDNLLKSSRYRSHRAQSPKRDNSSHRFETGTRKDDTHPHSEPETRKEDSPPSKVPDEIYSALKNFEVQQNESWNSLKSAFFQYEGKKGKMTSEFKGAVTNFYEKKSETSTSTKSSRNEHSVNDAKQRTKSIPNAHQDETNTNSKSEDVTFITSKTYAPAEPEWKNLYQQRLATRLQTEDVNVPNGLCSTDNEKSLNLSKNVSSSNSVTSSTKKVKSTREHISEIQKKKEITRMFRYHNQPVPYAVRREFGFSAKDIESDKHVSTNKEKLDHNQDSFIVIDIVDEDNNSPNSDIIQPNDTQSSEVGAHKSSANADPKATSDEKEKSSVNGDLNREENGNHFDSPSSHLSSKDSVIIQPHTSEVNKHSSYPSDLNDSVKSKSQSSSSHKESNSLSISSKTGKTSKKSKKSSHDRQSKRSRSRHKEEESKSSTSKKHKY